MFLSIIETFYFGGDSSKMTYFKRRSLNIHLYDNVLHLIGLGLIFFSNKIFEAYILRIL
jgi:hypothetical protein